MALPMSSTSADVDPLVFGQQLRHHRRRAGLTLAEIRQVLTISDGGEPPCGHVTDLIHRHRTDVEDRIRDQEAARQFDSTFIELARAVYVTNDERAAIKKRINSALGSRLVEEKSYKPYR